MSQHAHPKEISARLGNDALLGRKPGASMFGEVPKKLSDEQQAQLTQTQETLVEEIFFASLGTEEANRARPGVVYIADLGQSSPDSGEFGWQVHRFEREKSYDAKHLTKLSPLCRAGETYLVATGLGTDLRIVGWGVSPSSFEFWVTSRAPKYLRITVLGPGSLVFEQGNNERLRTRSGTILRPPPWFFAQSANSKPRASSMERIYQSSEIHPSERGATDDSLQKAMEAVSRGGNGGLLLFRPLAAWSDCFATISQRLHPPIDLASSTQSRVDASYGTRAFDHDLYYEDMTPEKMEQYRKAEKEFDAAYEANDRTCQVVGRLAQVDGAVAISSELQVLGFGAKVAVGDGWRPPKVYKAVHHERERWEDFDLGTRGTRHRAAVCFADQDELNLALIVSHDGDAAAVFKDGDDVVYWPIVLKTYWSGGGINDWF